MVHLSFRSSWTLTLIAPANRRKGSITLTSNSLKSNSSVISSTALKILGEIRPTTVIKTDSERARTISPIVCGNFNNLMLIKEKIDAKQSKMVDNSKTPKIFILLNIHK